MPFSTLHSWDELLRAARRADVAALLGTKERAVSLLRHAAVLSQAGRDEEHMLLLCARLLEQVVLWRWSLDREPHLIIKRRHFVGDASCSLKLMQQPRSSESDDRKPVNRLQVFVVDVPLQFAKLQQLAGQHRSKFAPLIFRPNESVMDELHFGLSSERRSIAPPGSTRLNTPEPSLRAPPVPSIGPPSVPAFRTDPPPAQGSNSRVSTPGPTPSFRQSTTIPLSTRRLKGNG